MTMPPKSNGIAQAVSAENRKQAKFTNQIHNFLHAAQTLSKRRAAKQVRAGKQTAEDDKPTLDFAGEAR